MNLSLSKLPWYAQVGIFFGLSVAAIAIFYVFYVSPAEADAEAKRSQLQGLRAEVTRGFVIARKLPQYRAQVKTLESRLEELKTVLPDEKDMGELLRRIQNLAVQSNLTIRGFRPVQVPVKRQLHDEWPIQLELDGTYHNLAQFFDRLGKFPRIINVNDVGIRAKEPPEPTSTITSTCVATTFVLIDPAKAAAAKRPPVAPRPGGRVG